MIEKENDSSNEDFLIKLIINKWMNYGPIHLQLSTYYISMLSFNAFDIVLIKINKAAQKCKIRTQMVQPKEM